MNEDKKPVGRPKQSKTFDKKQEVRCFEEDKTLVKQAADLDDVAASEVWRTGALKEAKRIIRKHNK